MNIAFLLDLSSKRLFSCHEQILSFIITFALRVAVVGTRWESKSNLRLYVFFCVFLFNTCNECGGENREWYVSAVGGRWLSMMMNVVRESVNVTVVGTILTRGDVFFFHFFTFFKSISKCCVEFPNLTRNVS